MKSIHNELAARSEALERLWGLAHMVSGAMQWGMAERGLTLARSELLWRLLHEGPCTQRSLSRSLHVTPRNVTGLVDALEADGFVTRSDHPSDRRATLVDLTEKGRAAVAAMKREQDGAAEMLFKDVSSDDLESFVRVMDHVRRRLDELLRPTP